MHGPIDEAISLGLATSTYWKQGTARYSEPGKSLGTEIRKLAASVHNPPDSDGWRAPSDYSGQHVTSTSGRITYCLAGACAPSGFTGGKDHVIQPPLLDFPNFGTFGCPDALAAARQRCLGKLAAKTADLSVAFMERKKTAKTAYDCINGVIRTVRDLKRGRLPPGVDRRLLPRHALKDWRTYPELWLLGRYGVAPTVYDVYDACELIEKLDNGSFDRYIVTCRGRSQKETTIGSSVNTYIGRFYTAPVNIATMKYVRSEAKVRVDACLSSAFYRSLSAAGVTNPLTTAWELVPYSFVCDWFLGVGDFLEGVLAPQGYTFKGGSETVFQELKYTEKYTGLSGTTLQGKGPTREGRAFERHTLSSFPASRVLFQDDFFNWMRVVDSVSLLAQLLSKGNRINGGVDYTPR